MYICKQLLRQPMKTLAGILLIAMAVAILCICLGQAILAYNTQQSLDYTFTTIGVPTIEAQLKEVESPVGLLNQFLREVPEEIIDWLEDTAMNNPELVKCISNPTFSSAYIPGMIPDNLTNYDYHLPVVAGDDGYWNDMIPSPLGAPYTCAVLEIELEWIGEIEEVQASGVKADGTYYVADMPYVEVELEGRILQAVALQEGYTDPSGLKAKLKLILPDVERWNQLGIVKGERYLVYGMDYFYADWAYDSIPINYLAYYMWYNDAISLTLVDYGKFGALEWEMNDHCYYPINWSSQTSGEEGSRVQITQEEYQQRYGTPTIAHLSGTVEEFLDSDDGILWQRKLDEMVICNQAFPILGVDRIGYLANYANQRVRLVEGRDFTAEELESGARVCILSEHVAAASELTIGDTITPQFYEADENSPYQSLVSLGYGTVMPTAYFFTSQTPLADGEEYTIVGLYRYEEPWGDVVEDNYAFTPNTVFVPKSSVTVKSETANEGIFLSVVLENGMVSQFRELVDEAGYRDMFRYYDQGYSAVADSLHDYSAVVKQAVLVGLAVYGFIVVLFLVLYTGVHARHVSMMRSLGARRAKRFWYIFLSGMGIVIFGTVLGLLTSVFMWKNAMDMLAQQAAADISIGIEISVLLAIAAIQIALVGLLLAVQAMLMSTDKKGMK